MENESKEGNTCPPLYFIWLPELPSHENYLKIMHFEHNAVQGMHFKLKALCTIGKKTRNCFIIMLHSSLQHCISKAVLIGSLI